MHLGLGGALDLYRRPDHQGVLEIIEIDFACCAACTLSCVLSDLNPASILEEQATSAQLRAACRLWLSNLLEKNV